MILQNMQKVAKTFNEKTASISFDKGFCTFCMFYGDVNGKSKIASHVSKN